MLIFDIGANIGRYSIANYTDRTTLVAVEASPQTFQTLLQNTEQYPNIKCLNYAICDSTEPFVDFYICNQADTLSTLDKRWLYSSDSRWGPGSVNGDHSKNAYNIYVPTMSIDTLIKQYGIPDILKVDVEGAEELVIRSLTRKIPCLCFEWAAEWCSDICRTVDNLVLLGFTKFHIQSEDKYTYRPPDYEFNADECKTQIKMKIPKVDWGMIWAI